MIFLFSVVILRQRLLTYWCNSGGMVSYQYRIASVSMVLWLLMAVGCSESKILQVDPVIGLIGSEGPSQKVDESLGRIGQPFRVIESVTEEELAACDLVILNGGAFSRNDAQVADRCSALLGYVKRGGCLLVFEIDGKGYKQQYLPYGIEFSLKCRQGKGDWDFTEEIAVPEHPVFNRPNAIDYLRGLEESSRIVSIAEDWKILTSKDPRSPSIDSQIEKLECTTGTIFEADYGKGHILVCQPMIERYYAGCIANEPHYLEAGLLLFENIIQYMKEKAAGVPLPVVRALASPGYAHSGQTVKFKAGLEDDGQGLAKSAGYYWDFGDGQTSIMQKPEHTFAGDGVYWVGLKMVTGSGKVSRSAVRVQTGNKGPGRWDEILINAQMHRHYPDPAQRQRSYPTALVLDGMLEVYNRTKNPEILNYVEGFFAPLIDMRESDIETSRAIIYGNHRSFTHPAYQLYKITGKQIYLDICQEVWDKNIALAHTERPGPFTVGFGPRKTIVDELYFVCKEAATCYIETGDMTLLDQAASQMIVHTNYFLDPADSMYFQAIDLDCDTYWCSPERPTGLNDTKWGRGERLGRYRFYGTDVSLAPKSSSVGRNQYDSQ